jgi:predicted transport protein
MKAIDRFYPKIINGASQFIIPVFQRDYSWSEENCRQLWKDVQAIGTSADERGHFIGSVVYVATGDSAAGFTRWLLIDGQQRVTTITLLFTALRDHISEIGWQGSEDGPTVKRIEAYFLRNVQEEGDREIKLKLRRHDDATLQALINREERPHAESQKIRENYELFRELLADADPEVVYRGLNRLVVVDVTLERGVDDPQLIFESLNSTGVDLSSSDLIRNFILMRLAESEQTRLYNSYWSKIETLFRGNERIFDNFVRDFLALKTQPSKLERADRVYVAFRHHYSRIGEDPVALEALLEDLLHQARYYASFAVGNSSDELGQALSNLRQLGDVPAILVMRLYETFEKSKTLSHSEFLEALRLLESYLLRRAVTGAQTRGYGLEFAKIAYKIADQNPLASLKVALARISASYAFPGNDEFEKALLESNMYHKRVCFHLLNGLENRESKEKSDTSGYSIEHVLPQNENLREEWRKMLGPDWLDIQQTWLHRIGNLTLTGYNSTYSDRPFEEKKRIAGGFAQSSVRLNQDIREAQEWTTAEISRRGQRLARNALGIWPALDVDPNLVREQEINEKKAKAEKRKLEKVTMTERASALFSILRTELQSAFPDAIEMPEAKSVTYHDPEFFLEIIPRTNNLSLLVALDFNEIDDGDGFAQDTSDYTFITHATHSGGILIRLQDEADIDRTMKVIRRAHELQESA